MRTAPVAEPALAGARQNVVDEGPRDGPVLVLSNSLASTVSMWAPRAGALAKAGSRLTVIPDAAHLANIEQAGPFNGALLDFLGSHA